MRTLVAIAAVSFVLTAAVSFAQPPAATQPPPQPPPKPAPPPATPPVAQPAPQPPRPFPEGAKVAFVNIQRIANESAEGKTSSAKISALQTKKTNELNEKNKLLQAAQQKLQSGGLLSDAARAQLEKDLEKQNVELQRMQQDAQAEIQDLQQELQADFQKKLMPVIQQVAQEKGLQLLLSIQDAGVLWADTGLDLTSEVIKRLDAAVPASAPKPPAKPPME